MTNLLKEYHIGDWCKRGAWIILIIGVLEILLGIYTTFQQASASGGAPLSFTIADVLQVAFSVASTTLFYFLVLYSAGLVLNYVAAREEVPVSEEVAVSEPAAVSEEVPVSKAEEEHEHKDEEEEHEEEATQTQVK